MQRDLLLFDLDGTLTDSAAGIIESVQYAYKSMGIEVPPLEVLKTFVGPPLNQSAVLHGVPAADFPEFLAHYRVMFVERGMLNNSVYAGIPALLEQLEWLGYPMAVATSKPEEYARIILEHFGLAHHFEFIAGATMDDTRSAKADVIEHCLASLTELRGTGQSGTGPSGTEQSGTELPQRDRILMVGDREHDIEGARAHGIQTVGVSWGYAQPGELAAHNAFAIIDEPAQLKQYV